MIVLLARVLLAAVFVISAVAKIRNREESREAIARFGLPSPVARVLAPALPVAELASAGLLLSADPAAAAGAVLGLVLLLAFTVAIVVNLLRGNRFDCHCFGQLGGSQISWWTVARNIGLLVLAAVALVGAGGRGWVPAELAGYSTGELAAGLAVLLLVAVLAVLGWTVYTLLSRYGDVLLRLEALELGSGVSQPRLAPAFSLPDLDGVSVDLDVVLTRGKPVLLVFVSPTCSLCRHLLPEVAHWQQDADYPLEVVVISDGSLTSIREKVLEGAPGLRVLRETGRSVSKAYGVEGTPAAAMLGVDGRFVGPVVHGTTDIRHLVSRTVQAMVAAAPSSAPVPRQGAALEVHQVAPRPAAAGDALPPASMETEAGERVLLGEALAGDGVLLFWRTTCGYCSRILDEVKDLEGSVHVGLVTTSTTEEIRASGLRSVILRDASRTVNGALQIPGTPAAVAVSGGVLTSSVAVGGPDVLALLRARRSFGAEDGAIQTYG